MRCAEAIFRFLKAWEMSAIVALYCAKHFRGKDFLASHSARALYDAGLSAPHTPSVNYVITSI
jgi:hypothetical protein